MSDVLTKTRRKRCSECGELNDEVLGSQRLCAECERDRDYCRICDYWYSGYGDGCRHIQWSNELGLPAGCGSDHVEADDHRESFNVLLGKLAVMKTELLKWNGKTHRTIYEPLLPQLLKLIRQNRFWTQWHGPLIGGPPNLSLRYSMRGRDYSPELIDISAREQLDWGHVEAMQLGMTWLTSLDGKTKDANQLTAKWIREFLSRPLTPLP